MDGVISKQNLRVVAASLSDDAYWSHIDTSRSAHSLVTNGNGACAIHAVIGEVDAFGELFRPDARAWIGQVLAQFPRLSDVKSHCRARGVEMAHHRVSTLIADLVLEYTRGVAHSEQLLLAKTISELDVESGSNVWAGIYGALQTDGAHVRARALAKREVLDSAREHFFLQENSLSLIEPLSAILGYSEVFHEPAYWQKQDGSFYVRGTQHARPEGSAFTWGACLYDQRHEFDELRWQFMTSCDEVTHQVGIFRRYLLDIQESMSESQIAHMMDFIMKLEVLDQERVHVHALTPEILSGVWPAYVQTLQHDGYWLDTCELQLLCILADVALAIFTQQGPFAGSLICQ